MKSRFARLGGLLAAFVGLMATMVPTASATNIQNVTFVGTASLTDCPGLGYPGAPPDMKTPTPTVTTKTGPKGEPEVNVNPGGNHCNFGFSDNTCVKTSAGPKTPGVDDDCDISAAGTVWGFCGFSHGKGFATITSNKGTIGPTPFSFNAVGGELVVSGGNMNTNFYGVVTAIPPNNVTTPGTCTMKSARTFTIIGEVKIKDCTNGTTTVDGTPTGVCAVP